MGGVSLDFEAQQVYLFLLVIQTVRSFSICFHIGDSRAWLPGTESSALCLWIKQFLM